MRCSTCPHLENLYTLKCCGCIPDRQQPQKSFKANASNTWKCLWWCSKFQHTILTHDQDRRGEIIRWSVDPNVCHSIKKKRWMRVCRRVHSPFKERLGIPLAACLLSTVCGPIWFILLIRNFLSSGRVKGFSLMNLRMSNGCLRGDEQTSGGLY